eukprot:1649344-Ditylum_brightwellii.AAC.3
MNGWNFIGTGGEHSRGCVIKDNMKLGCNENHLKVAIGATFYQPDESSAAHRQDIPKYGLAKKYTMLLTTSKNFQWSEAISMFGESVPQIDGIVQSKRPE